MNRLDRLAAILIKLQAHGLVRGRDLASHFGTSLRTIYRDLRTLEEAGIPLQAEAGVGYRLMPATICRPSCSPPTRWQPC